MSKQEQYYPPPPQYGQQQSYPPPQQQYYPPQQQQYDSTQQQNYQTNPYGGMGQPQPYVAQQQVYSQPPPPTGSYAELIPKKESRFKSTEYKDIWATILWAVFVLGFAGISAFSIPYISKANTNSTSSTNPSTSNPSGSNNSLNIPASSIGSLIALSAVVGFLLSLGYFFLLQRFAGKLIKISLVVSVAVTTLAGIYFLYMRIFFAGIIWLVFAAIYAWCFYSWRSHIPFASAMLKSIADITKKYPSLIGVGVGGLILQFGFICWWVLTLVGVSIASQNNSIGDGAAYFIYIYTLFTFYWTSQVISNGVHITVAGVFATFYFRGVAQPNGTVDVPVSNPTVASLKRALTTSLGPNCYGSLLIAIIQTIKALADNARSNNSNDNILCTLVLCCISCILALIRDLLEYFNKYAFAQVAIYGKDYCSAAKDTWALTKARGIDAIINDNLIGSVLTMGGLFIGLITAGAAALFVLGSDSMSKSDATYFIVCLVAFFIGVVEFSVLANVIDSGVVTTFVCLAEDPLALAQTKPALYQKIQQVYPQVVLGF